MNELLYTSNSTIIGVMFFCSGMTLFLGMIAYAESMRVIRQLYNEAVKNAESCAFDTDVFPDYNPDSQCA